METMTIIWLVLAVVMAALEAATVQLVSIWFVVGSVAACVTSLFTDNIIIQAVVFIAVTGIALIATRPLVKKIRSKKAEATNSDRYIGMEGVVTSAIDNLAAKGQVRVAGTVWTARSTNDDPIPEGIKVTVIAIEGVKLIVKPL